MTRPEPATHYSGVLVVVPPARIPETVRRLESLRSVEVHRVHAPSGRVVVVLETETLKEHESRLLEVRGLPHVVLAEPVYYFVDSDPDDVAVAPSAGIPRGEPR